jgi:integrase/recombinase XerD
MRNPCNALLVSKAFKGAKPVSRKIPEKELVDELIYNTQSLRDRLLLELQARCGLRIGESLKIRVSDICERRILLREPKSGKRPSSRTCRKPSQRESRITSGMRTF